MPGADQSDAGRVTALDHRCDVPARQEEQVGDAGGCQRRGHHRSPVVIGDGLVPAVSPSEQCVPHGGPLVAMVRVGQTTQT